MSVPQEFSKEQSEQEASPLFSLPFEIRYQILHWIFKCDQPFHVIPPSQRRPQWIKSFYKQVAKTLRTCQKMFNEGVQIYQTNTIDISCDMWLGSVYCNILDVRIAMGRRRPCAWGYRDLLPLTKEYEFYDPSKMNTYQILWHFSNINIKFPRFLGPQYVHMLCHMLTDVVRGKNVTMFFEDGPVTEVWDYNSNRIGKYIEGIGGIEEARKTAILSCHYLRCKSFVLTNPWGIDTERIAQTVVSSRPVPDLFDRWGDMYWLFAHKPIKGNPCFREMNELLYYELDGILMRGDERHFAKFMIKLTERRAEYTKLVIKNLESTLHDIDLEHRRLVSQYIELDAVPCSDP